MTKVAIMQPSYLPWLGYFGLMAAVDVFVLLDSVRFEGRGWQQRNRVKSANGATWMTVPVHKKGRREQALKDVMIDRGRGFPRPHVETLRRAYGKAPYFSHYAAEICAHLEKENHHLVELTASLIAYFAGVLHIKTPLVRSSELSVDGHKADLLANICGALDGDAYVSPLGARDYLSNSDVFCRRGIGLSFHAYKHPIYPQLHGEFLTQMSVVDLLSNCGDASGGIIRRGIHILRQQDITQ